MSPSRSRAISAAIAVTTITALGACSAADGEEQPETQETITVETTDGAQEVPAQPERVVVLDNTAMETVRDMGITPVALPKPLLPGEGFEQWADNDDILDIGMHREPKLELVSEAQPDLIIGGYRFEEYTEELSDIAPVIDIAPEATSEDGWVAGLKEQTTTLGEIFDEQDTAEQLVADLEEATEAAAGETQGERVFLAVASGNIVDNGAGRIAPLIEPLELSDAFAEDSDDLDSTSVHQDSGLAPETVAQADPDWAIVLDRDAAISTETEAAPAEELFAAQQAWQDTTFMSQDHIIVLDKYFYTREGIQAYTEAYEQIADAFATA